MLPHALRLTPEYRDYVWGGQRLRPGSLTAEAWIVHENDRIVGGTLTGRTLANVTAEYGAALLGAPVIESRGTRFPLLVKLLDCNQWLSVQVHPDDEQARRMEGAGQNGKTEAWHILDSAQDAQIIAGLKPGISGAEFEHAVRTGGIAEMANYLRVTTGDTVFMPAGTIHALGPGLLVYEVQETSDITYRVFDWNRPQANGRVLHIDKSLAVANPHAHARPLPQPPLSNGDCKVLCASPYFTLEILHSLTSRMEMDTLGRSFHILTVIEGSACLYGGDEMYELAQFETVLVPAEAGAYRLEPMEAGFKVLRSSVQP